MPRREAPLDGSSSFFHEKLIEWRELNAAHDWLECYRELHPLCTTLAQLVHHQEAILSALLGRSTMACRLSLEPILDLMSVLARDLASDFLVHLEKVFIVLTDLVRQGADGDAEVLKFMYTSMSSILKNLAKYLILDLKPLLSLTMALRHHKSEHVRKFTADALGFLIRRASDQQAEDAIQYLYAECLDQQEESCYAGNGELMASSIKGVNSGLHSRCDRILNLVFQDDLVPLMDDVAVWSTRRTCLVSCFEYVRDAEYLAPVWSLLLEYFHTKIFSNRFSAAGRCMELTSRLVRHRKGSRVHDAGMLVSMVDSCFENNAFLECDLLESSMFEMMQSLFRYASSRGEFHFEYSSWEAGLGQSNTLRYLDFVSDLCSTKNSNAETFIPLAIKKILHSRNLPRRQIWGYVMDLSEYVWSMNATMVKEDMHGLSKLAQEAILSADDTESFWAALQCSKSVFSSIDDGDIFFSAARDTLRSCSSKEWYLAMVAAVHVAQADSTWYYSRRKEFTDSVFGILRSNPSDFFSIKAATAALPYAEVSNVFDEHVVGCITDNLLSRNQRMRINCLQISSFVLKCSGPNDPLSHLLDLERHPLGVDSGRHAVVCLGRVQNTLEYKKVSSDIARATVRGLVGLLHVKLSSYWAPASKALAAAVCSYPSEAWPVVLQALIRTQNEFLHNRDDSSSSECGSKFEQYLDEVNAESFSDAAARLSHLLRALAEIHTDTLSRYSKEWVPVFLAFCNQREVFGRDDDDHDDEVEVCPERHLHPRIWRGMLRDWLKVLLSFKSLLHISNYQKVLESVACQIMDIDPLVQKTVLQVLQLFKLEWLNPYLENLLRLVDNKTMRAELTAFPIAPSSTSVRKDDNVVVIESEHRKDLLPLLIAILFPRMRKRNGRLGGKGAPGSARVAILNFLSGSKTEELSALLELFLLPLSPCFGAAGNGEELRCQERRLYLPSSSQLWWGPKLGTETGKYWMDLIDINVLNKQPIRRHIGYINAIDDLVKHLGFKFVAYFPVICALLLKMLRLSVKMNEKEVRVKCLRLISVIIDSFPTQVDFGFMWGPLYDAIQDFADLIPIECNAVRPPALVDLCKSLSEHTGLVDVLASVQYSRVFEKCCSVLTANHCSEGCRSTVLDIIENLFDHNRQDVLLEHINVLLEGLDCTLKDFRKHRAAAKRSLQILERLCESELDEEHVRRLASAMIHLLVIPKRKWQTESRRKVDEELISRACGAVGALWRRLDGKSSGFEKVPGQLAPLILILQSSEARICLCEAMLSLGKLRPQLCEGATFLSSLNTMSEHSLDEPDYDSRLETYSALVSETWERLFAADEGMCSMLVYQCCVDLANPSDLSLRHASARALEGLILFVKKNGDDSIVKRVLMPEIRRRLVSSSLTVRQEHLELVRKVASNLPESYPELQAVTHPDEDIDFWMNVCHVQLHRRARAFSRLDASSLHASLVRGYVLPLVEKAIVEGLDTEGLSHGVKQIDLDKHANVTDAAINLLTSLSSSMHWEDLKGVLTRYMQLMDEGDRDGSHLKSIIRAFCCLVSNCTEDYDCEFLDKTVIPALQAKLVFNETVRTPVAMAIIKVLKLLPDTQKKRHLPRTLQIVCNLLRLRLQRIRDDARVVLASMAEELGPAYLVFFLQVLKTSLPSRGFMAHVLGYTFHDILKAVATEARATPGCLDSCLHQIIPVIEGDLFGEIADAKEASEFSSSYKESKRCKANDTFLLLSTVIDLEASLADILDIVWERLPMASNPKLRSKLGLLLQYASKGICDNESVSFGSLSEMCYGVLHRVAQEDALRYGYMMAEFALSTYQIALKKKKIVLDPECCRSESFAKVFDVVLGELGRSRSSGVVCAALQVLCDMAVCDKTKKDELIKAIDRLLKKCPNTAHPISQECFRVLAALVTHGGEAEDLHVSTPVLEWAFSDVGDDQSAFILLKALVKKKIVHPTVYDVMGKVEETMVKSQSASIRQLSSTVLLSFLLDYPLGKRVLERHLQFLLANLEYEYESGREACVLLLKGVVQKFPPHVLNTWSDKISIVLLVRLENEESKKLKGEVCGVLRELLVDKVDVETFRRFVLEFCCDQWLQNESIMCSVTVLLREMMIYDGSQMLTGEKERVLQEAIDRIVGSFFSNENEVTFSYLHKFMVFLESCLDRYADRVAGRLKPFAGMLTELLEHSHVWIRTAASRVVGSALSLGRVFDESEYVDLSRKFVAQLEAPCDVSDSSAESYYAQAVKCLVFVLPELDDAFIHSAVVDHVCKVADSASYVKRMQRRYALRFIAASVSRLGPSRIHPFLCRLLMPIHRIISQIDRDSSANDDDGVTSLAQEIFAHVKKIVGAEVAVAEYNKAREAVQNVRTQRRVARKLLEMNEPEKAATIRVKRNLRKKHSAKKKISLSRSGRIQKGMK